MTIFTLFQRLHSLRCCRNARWESCWLFECLCFREFHGFQGSLLWILAADSPAVEPCGDSLFYGGVSTGWGRESTEQTKAGCKGWMYDSYFYIIFWCRYWQAQMIAMTACFDLMTAKICDAMKSDDSCTYIHKVSWEMQDNHLWRGRLEPKRSYKGSDSNPSHFAVKNVDYTHLEILKDGKKAWAFLVDFRLSLVPILGKPGFTTAERVTSLSLHLQDGKQQVMQVAAHIAAGTSFRVGGRHWSGLISGGLPASTFHIFEMGVI